MGSRMGTFLVITLCSALLRRAVRRSRSRRAGRWGKGLRCVDGFITHKTPRLLAAPVHLHDTLVPRPHTPNCATRHTTRKGRPPIKGTRGVRHGQTRAGARGCSSCGLRAGTPPSILLW
eukprot:scaffold127944_cov72-Phaeocystis_antarctica.AAC.8